MSSAIGKRVLKYTNDVSIKTLPFKPSRSFPQCLSQVSVNGPLGQLNMPIFPFVSLNWPAPPEDAQKTYMTVQVEDPSVTNQRAMWGTTNAKLANMIEGVTLVLNTLSKVTYGFTLPVKLVGVGYRATLDTEGQVLAMKLGYANVISIPIPSSINVLVPNPQRIVLKSIDLEAVTLFAASIRKWRPPEPFNQKGVFVGDETIKKKEGKKR